jgi:hypothetical protein
MTSVRRQPVLRFRIVSLLVVAGVFVGACTSSSVVPDSEEETVVTKRNGFLDGETAVVWHGADGNRMVDGAGPLAFGDPVDVAIGDDPITWLVGAVAGGAPVWFVVDEAGAVGRIGATSGDVLVFEAVGTIASSGPPSLRIHAGELDLMVPGGGDSPFAPSVLNGGVVVGIGSDGNVRIGDSEPLGIGALPDARVVFDGAGRALVLSGATDRYRHGVLGDEVEASSVSLIDLEAGSARELFRVGPDEVIEGTAPIWADVDGDGNRDIVVTISTPSRGSKLAVFDGSGRLVAESDWIGRSSRWRHQIAVAPIGPSGEVEIVDVLTPHIGGPVEFFRVSGGRLDVVASHSGFTSHFFGSRNLSVPVVADADGDAKLEVILPTTGKESVGGVRRTSGGAETAWLVPLGGVLSSNLSAITLPAGGLALAAGRADGTVRIWLATGDR